MKCNSERLPCKLFKLLYKFRDQTDININKIHVVLLTSNVYKMIQYITQSGKEVGKYSVASV